MPPVRYPGRFPITRVVSTYEAQRHVIPFKVTGYGDEESGRDHHKLANRFGVADSIRADTTIDLCQFRIITGYRKVGPARRGAAAGS